MHSTFNETYAKKAVRLSLDCVEQEFPNTYERVDKKIKPKEIHPAFFGCYDWHSSVHGHWAMLRVLHAFPKIAEKEQIIATLDRHLKKDLLKKEENLFRKEPNFELPYGVGWFLRLVAEVRSSHLPEAKQWSDATRSLEQLLVQNLYRYLKSPNLPNRTGLHDNTAFALMHAWDYAVAVGEKKLQNAVRAAARKFYFSDESCSLVSEPKEGDFISPCFVEADLMRRILSEKEFANWEKKFFPVLEPSWLAPVIPSNPKDYFLSHMIGLMYQKASSMRSVGLSLDGSDPRREVLLRASQEQSETGWNLLFDSGYGGTHWIASFAIFYYTNAGESVVHN